MAAIGVFGKVREQWPPFNLPWREDATPGALVTIFQATNAEAVSRWVTKIYISGEVTCSLELHIDGALVWGGRTTVTELSKVWDFSKAEFEWPASTELEVKLLHDYTALETFDGNVGGFIR